MGAYIPKPGELFEQRFELLETLGVGGIGTVFKARQIDSNRLIALKIMHLEFAEDEVFQQRFLREGRSLNRISHPNIVSVYHLGISEQGLPYLAMEFIEGESLRRIITEQKRLNPEKAVHICKQLCSALEAMHKDGIVHRDLKPDNVIVMQIPEADFVKIVDFGLVRMIEDHQRESQRLTATGVVLGSPAYMSPEQCKGQKVENRSDIYALAVCMYEMLTGKTPFSADNFVELMYKHAKEPVPVIERSILGSYTNRLNKFVQKGMAKKPDARFQSANEMLEYLDNESLLNSAGTEKSKANKSLKVALACAIPLSLALGGYYLYTQMHSQTLADSVPLSSTIQKSTKTRYLSPKTLSLLNDHDLLLAAENPTTPDDLKCQAYIKYGWEHRLKPEGLDAAIKARALCLKLEARGIKSEQLSYSSQLVLAEANHCHQKYDESYAGLQALLSKDASAQIPMQCVLRAKALLAELCAARANTAQSLALLKDVTNWEYGIAFPASDYAMTAALKLKRNDIAKKVCLQLSTLGSIVNAARLSRCYNEPAVDQLCIDHGKSQIKNSTIRLKNLEKEPLSDAMYNFKIEESWLDIHQGRYETAKSRVLSLSSKTEAIELLKKDSCYAFPLALILRRLGLYREALDVAKMQTNPDMDLRTLIADVLVLEGRLDEASKFIGAENTITDPETGQSEHAIDRVNALKAGKADSTKGLCKWPGIY